LECKYHSGQEADLVCMQCGQPYCRECVKETRESHCCPDCHRASVERLAAQMGGRKEPKPVKVKEPKPPKVKEPKVAKEKPPKDDKKLRKPAEVLLPPTMSDLKPPAPPVAPPASSLTPDEKAAFWGDSQKPAAPQAAAQAPGAVPQAPSKAPAGAPGRPDELMRVEGLPPPLPKAQQASPVGAPLGPPPSKGEPVKKRPIPTPEAREQAVMTAEGFPTGGRKSKKAAAAEAAEDVAAVTVAAAAGEDVLGIPRSRRERKRAHRIDTANLPVAMQVPEDYDGEVTTKPTYFKAILLAMGVGLVGAGAYAGIAWWLHKDLGIFGWVLGFGVGVAISFGSGRHYSWKLGLIAAAISMFWVSVGRIGYYMLDVRFNNILPLKLGIWPLFRESLTTYGNQFLSLWLLFFIMSGAVAFLVAFRPPPIKLQLSGEPQRRVAGKGA